MDNLLREFFEEIDNGQSLLLEGKYDLTNDESKKDDETNPDDKYGLDSAGAETDDEAPKEDDSEPTPTDAPKSEDNQDTNLQQDNTQEDAQDDTTTDDSSGSDSDMDFGFDDNTDDQSTNDEVTDSENQDTAPEEPSIPEIKILDLTNEQMQINNSKLMDEFLRLQNNLDNTIVILRKQTSINDLQTTIVEGIIQNLSELGDNIDNYIKYSYSKSYESNVKVFLTYLTQYNSAVKLNKITYDEFSKSKKDK